jgi:hypothetical protein
MLIADHRRNPDDTVPSRIAVEPWSGFVYLYDHDDEDDDASPPPPRNRRQRKPRLTFLERWFGLTGAAAAALLLYCR